MDSHIRFGPLSRKSHINPFVRDRKRSIGFAGLVLIVTCVSKIALAQHSVARIWDDQLLHAISIDTARPTVHARNLFNLSTAMYWGIFWSSNATQTRALTRPARGI
jgi:hypothetical protein